MQKMLQITSETDTNPFQEPKYSRLRLRDIGKPLQVKLKPEPVMHRIFVCGLTTGHWRRIMDLIQSADVEISIVDVDIGWPSNTMRPTFFNIRPIDLEGTSISSETPYNIEHFERERRAFLRIRDDLLQDEMYVEQFVAIYGGQVVGHDRDIVELASRMYSQYGYVPIYIDKVKREEEVVELPSPEG